MRECQLSHAIRSTIGAKIHVQLLMLSFSLSSRCHTPSPPLDSCPLITPVSDCLFLCLLSLSGQLLIRISVLLLLLFLDDASTNVPNCKLIYYFPLFFCLLFLFVYCSAKNRQTTTAKLVLLMPVVVLSFSPVSWCFCFYLSVVCK